MQFVAGATGSSAPVSGMRSLYGDPAAVEDPSWDDIIAVDGVTLSTWPATSRDPANEARYSLDSEIEVEVQRADGSFTTGFASAPNNEFIEYVVWQDGETWLALLARDHGQHLRSDRTCQHRADRRRRRNHTAR